MSGQSLSGEDRDTLLRIARETLISYLEHGTYPEYETAVPALLEPRATFVTLRRHDTGKLRGCRGEFVARYPLVQSVMQTTVASATDDPRFSPVTPDEVPLLSLEISALTPMNPIDPDDIVVGRHGLMLVKGRCVGLLLPQAPVTYGWERNEYLENLCQKARLPNDAWQEPGVELLAFEAEVWGDGKI